MFIFSFKFEVVQGQRNNISMKLLKWSFRKIPYEVIKCNSGSKLLWNSSLLLEFWRRLNIALNLAISARIYRFWKLIFVFIYDLKFLKIASVRIYMWIVSFMQTPVFVCDLVLKVSSETSWLRSCRFTF